MLLTRRFIGAQNVHYIILYCYANKIAVNRNTRESQCTGIIIITII